MSCLLHATYFDFYLGHYQENSIKLKQSYLNLVALLWNCIMQFFVVVIIKE
jgi:hypothetical protein